MPSEPMSLAEMREQLRSLERERDAWAAQRQALRQRDELLERARQARRAEVAAPRNPPETAESSPSVAAAELIASKAEKTVEARNKREEIQQLREKTLQLLKTQQQVASKITSQLRSINGKKSESAVTSAASSVAGSRSPSPPPEKPATTPTRKHNKLVLVPTTVNALGKRQPGSAAVLAPPVSYPQFSEAKELAGDSLEEREAAALRVAARYFLRSGERITIIALHESTKAYLGRSLPIEDIESMLERPGTVLDLLVRDDLRRYEEYRENQPIHIHNSPAAESIGASVEQIRAWVEVEKAAVEELASSWTAGSQSDSRIARLNGSLTAHSFTKQFADQRVTALVTIETALTRLLGAATEPPAPLETAYPHISPALHEAQQWLKNSVHHKDSQLARDSASSSLQELKFDRPFDLNGSVMKQVVRSRKGKGVKRRRHQRADPMKVMCMYELSGVCNDRSCNFQHQRDFDDPSLEADGEEDDTEAKNDSDSLVTPATRTLMNQFVQLREELRPRWPSFVDIINYGEQASTPRISTKQVHRSADDAPVLPLNDETSADRLTADFIELGSPLSETTKDAFIPSSRYCRDDEMDGDEFSSSVAMATLEDHLRQNPEDVDAWLLLALRSLELEISCSDENVRLSHANRLQSELEELHSLLQSPSSASQMAVTEGNVARSLHVLSRALEVEANAYCEEPWLFHLRLSQLLTSSRDVDAELQMTEQALGFVRSSVSLWRHFLSLRFSGLHSLDEAVTMHSSLIQAITAASQQAKPRHVKDAFSVLLCDVTIQFCAVYCEANRPADASNLLWSLLEGRTVADTGSHQDTSTTNSSLWQQAVRDRMLGDDILVLYVLHVHISLFGSVPLWLRERSFTTSDAINVYRMLLPIDRKAAQIHDSSEALEICNAACNAFSGSEFVPPGIEVLRHNWIVIAACSTDITNPERLVVITKISDEELERATLVPRVITALATVFRDRLAKSDVATQLIEELMSRYKSVSSTLPVNHVYQRFGEALHHYLLHRPDHFATDPFHSYFPTLKFVIVRLDAILPTKDPVYSKRGFKNIVQELNEKARREMLVVLFSALIRDTFEHIVKCQLGDNSLDNPDDPGNSRGTLNDSDEQDITQDTYYLVAQAQLLCQVCGARAAVDTLEMVVMRGGASKWSVLPRECRRMVWSMRFVLQLELLKQADELSPTPELFQLLDRYLADVGPQGDTSHAARQQIANSLVSVDDQAIPRMGATIGVCVKYGGLNTAMTSALDNELFRLCLAATPAHERPTQFAAFQHRLEMYPRFLLDFADAALQESDWGRVRSGLRRMVFHDASKPVDSTTLRSLVLLELKNKNVHGLAHLLSHRLKTNPLDGVTWQMIGTLEILFGASNEARVDGFASMLANTHGVVIPFRPVVGAEPSGFVVDTARADLSGSLLTRVPTLSLMDPSRSLETLDLSNNLLVSLPPTICRLARVRVLKLSGNALATLPPSIGQLTQLHVIELAHNNLSAIPNAFWDGLVELRDVDLRANALSLISPRVVKLQHLKTLRVRGNNFAWKELEPIAAKLPAGCRVDIDPRSDGKPLVTKETKETAGQGASDSTPATTETDQLNSSDSKPVPTEKVDGKDPSARRSETVTDESKQEADQDVDMENSGEDRREDNGSTREPPVEDEPKPTEVSSESSLAQETSDKPEKSTPAESSTASPAHAEAKQSPTDVIDLEDDNDDENKETKSDGTSKSDSNDDVDMSSTSCSNDATPKSGEVSWHVVRSMVSLSRDPSPRDQARQASDNHDNHDDEVQFLGSCTYLPASSSPPSCPPSASSARSEENRRLVENALRLPTNPSDFTPTQWWGFVADHVPEHTDFPSCSLCRAPNESGTHQRFGCLNLCVACLEVALDVLKHRIKNRPR